MLSGASASLQTYCACGSKAGHLFVLFGFLGLGGLVLVAEVVVALVQLLALLLEGLEIQVLLGELLLEGGDLIRGLDGRVLVAVVGADALLEADNVLDHDIGAVENQGEEEGEAAEVHVALGVKLAGLDFGALVAEDDTAGKRTKVSFGAG